MFACILLFFVLIYIFCSDTSTKREKKRQWDEMVENGYLLPRAPAIELAIIEQDIKDEYLWVSDRWQGEALSYIGRSRYPTVSNSAYTDYKNALVDQELRNRGYRPEHLPVSRNLKTGDVFGVFNDRYGEKVKYYNEKGRFVP